MIDGIHFEIPSEAVFNSDILEFKCYGNIYRAKYNGFIIDHYGQFCKVSGSIHKYFNDGVHNYNDFTISDYMKALDDLSKVLNVNPEIIRIGRIEIGVNIELDTDYNVYDFLSSVFMLGYKMPEKLGQIGFVFKFREYDLKIYSKKLDKHKEKLRIELVIKHKSKRNVIIKESAPYCNTLMDLSNSDIWKAFGCELLKVFDNIIIIDKDNIDYNNLTPKELKLLINRSNPFYWKKELSRQTRNNHLKRFLNIIKKDGGNRMKDEVKQKIKTKINDLICMNNNLPQYDTSLQLS